MPRPDNSLISPVNWPAPIADDRRVAVETIAADDLDLALEDEPGRRVALADVEDRSRPAPNVRGALSVKRLAVSICLASSTGNICSRRFSISDMASPDSPGRPISRGRDADVGTSPDFRQRLHVAESLRKNIARAGQPAFVALRDRRAAEAKRDRRAFRPIGDLARGDHGAGIGLALHPHRHVEIDLLAPGQSRRRRSAAPRRSPWRSACRAARRRA